MLNRFTSQIKEHAREMAESLGRPYIYLNSPKTSKEDIKGFSNADIRKVIYPRSMQNNPCLVGKTTRLLAKLRAHGLIAKIPRSFRYRPTAKGLRIMTTILRVKKKEIPGQFDIT